MKKEKARKEIVLGLNALQIRRREKEMKEWIPIDFFFFFLWHVNGSAFIWFHVDHSPLILVSLSI